MFMFQRTLEPDLMSEAARLFTTAAEAASGRGHQPAMLWHNYAIALRRIGDITGNPDTVREAVSADKKALASLPAKHPDRVTCQTNLGGALTVLAELTEDKQAAAEAVNVLRDAASAAPADSRSKTECLANLGAALRQLHLRTGGRGRYLAEAEESYLQAAGNAGGEPARRVLAFAEASALACQRVDGAPAALDAAEAAVELLMRLDLASLRMTDQHFRMGVLNMLPGQAGAAAIAAGRPDRAVELLELTRGVALRSILDAGGVQTDGATSISQLTTVADQGPVVLVNVSRSRCDALILTGDADAPVRLVPLPGLTEADINANADKLAAIYHGSGISHLDAQETTIKDILSWLWDALAEPVLAALGYLGTPPGSAPMAAGADPPRVWWCPVGALAQLPIHAAGHHEDLTSDDSAASKCLPD